MKTSDAPDVSIWQTYRNKEYGFEFKYPEKWLVRDKIFETACQAQGLQDCLLDIANYDISVGYTSPGENAVRGITYCEAYNGGASKRCEVYRKFIIDWEFGNAMIYDLSGGIEVLALKIDSESSELFRKILFTFKFISQRSLFLLNNEYDQSGKKYTTM